MRNLRIGLNEDDPVVLQLVDSIIAGATGDAALSGSSVSLVDLGALGAAGGAAITAEVQAKDAWTASRLARQAVMQDVRRAVKKYATFAYSVYGDDPAKLQGLGLGLASGAVSVTVLPAPGNLRSRPGKMNETTELKWNRVRGRSTFVAQCAEAADGPWKEIYNGPQVSATCTALISGKEYFFRVRAIGPNGPGTWSDITHTRAS